MKSSLQPFSSFQPTEQISFQDAALALGAKDQGDLAGRGLGKPLTCFAEITGLL